MAIDLIIIALLVGIIIRGRKTGFVRQFFSAIGFVGGLFIGAFLQPYAMQYADTTLSRALLSIVVTLGCALLLSNFGEQFGAAIKHRLQHRISFNKADAVLGSTAGVVTILAAVWLLAPVVSGLPTPNLQQALRESAIVSALNRNLPSAPNFIAGINKLINPNGFPEVFAELERQPLQPDAPLPSLGDLGPAVEATRASIVKLEGRGCGGLVDGSGFVAADNIIVTNAHVVAGVDEPKIIDTNGYHDTTAIWFDPALDMAVLRVTSGNLAGKPLALDTQIAGSGTPSVVAGYPGGGGFTVSPSVVLDQLTARGRDIYGRGLTNRSIYELKADIVPGNSGGPLIDKDGEVIGLVFAESVTYEDIGYALTIEAVAAGLHRAIQQNQPVSTGACAG